MHYSNWYSAMCFNRMLKRTGHFWEGRYRSTSFPEHEQQRALNTLRYIHANPKTAGMRKSYFYACSNYGIYHRLSDDGLTEWHPAFLARASRITPRIRPPRRHLHRRQCLTVRAMRKTGLRGREGLRGPARKRVLNFKNDQGVPRLASQWWHKQCSRGELVGHGTEHAAAAQA